MVFLFVLISSLLKNTILFSWLIDGFLILKFYLIFSLFGCFFCIRAKSFFTFSFYNSKGKFVTKHLRDIKPVAQHSKVLKDVFFTRSLFKTNIVVPTYSNHPDDILLFHYNSKKNYDSLTMYLTQYQKGKKISDKEICTFYNNPSKGTNTGNIALVVDYEASTLKIIDAFEDGYYVAEGISFLENISHYDVWDYNQIEEKISIKYSKKQMLVALSYGKNHVTSLPIKELETNKKIKNDYTCILSIKFK